MEVFRKRPAWLYLLMFKLKAHQARLAVSEIVFSQIYSADSYFEKTNLHKQ